MHYQLITFVTKSKMHFNNFKSKYTYGKCKLRQMILAKTGDESFLKYTDDILKVELTFTIQSSPICPD